MKYRIIQTVAIAAALFTPNAFAHIGIHNDVHHPLIGAEHFFVILAVGLISGIALYCYKK